MSEIDPIDYVSGACDLGGNDCSGCWCWTLHALMLIYVYAVARPLAALYLKGPRAYAFGFWAGADPSDICHELSNGFAGAHWAVNRDACLRQIRHRFEAMLVATTFVLATALMCHVIAFAWRHLVAAPLEARRKVRMLEARARIACDCVRLLSARNDAGDAPSVVGSHAADTYAGLDVLPMVDDMQLDPISLAKATRSLSMRKRPP